MRQNKYSNPNLEKKVSEIVRIGREGVLEALEENKRRNIPSVFFSKGRIHYLLPSGKVVSAWHLKFLMFLFRLKKLKRRN